MVRRSSKCYGSQSTSTVHSIIRTRLVASDHRWPSSAATMLWMKAARVRDCADCVGGGRGSRQLPAWYYCVPLCEAATVCPWHGPTEWLIHSQILDICRPRWSDNWIIDLRIFRQTYFFWQSADNHRFTTRNRANLLTPASHNMVQYKNISSARMWSLKGVVNC